MPFSKTVSTTEEWNLAKETIKILQDDSIRVSCDRRSRFRIPVPFSSVNIETAKPISANEVRAVLSSAAGIVVYDDPHKNLYPTAIDVAGKDEIYVGRIREDESITNGINLWIVSDNLRKGAALNALQIAELLIQ